MKELYMVAIPTYIPESPLNYEAFSLIFVNNFFIRKCGSFFGNNSFIQLCGSFFDIYLSDISSKWFSWTANFFFDNWIALIIEVKVDSIAIAVVDSLTG